MTLLPKALSGIIASRAWIGKWAKETRIVNIQGDPTHFSLYRYFEFYLNLPSFTLFRDTIADTMALLDRASDAGGLRVRYDGITSESKLCTQWRESCCRTLRSEVYPPVTTYILQLLD